jgi:uncharacterized membrane protein HdeD (DUF308 family)
VARHPLDVASLVAGLAFVLIGVVSLVGDLSFRSQTNLMWPVLLAALGLSLLLSNRTRDAADR